MNQSQIRFAMAAHADRARLDTKLLHGGTRTSRIRGWIVYQRDSDEIVANKKNTSHRMCNSVTTYLQYVYTYTRTGKV